MFQFGFLYFSLLVLFSMLHSIVQWNIRSLRTNNEELKVLFSKHDPNIVCLQETRIPTACYNIGLNYCFYGSTPVINNNRPSGGAAIVVKKNISHHQIPLRTTLQAVAIKASFKKCYTICSLYLDPSTPVSLLDLQNLRRVS